MLFFASMGKLFDGKESKELRERTINLCVESASMTGNVANRMEKRDDAAAGSDR